MSYADNPRAPKPDPSDALQEPTGPVAADSLAAESNQAGGGFSENDNVAELGVRGNQSTLANTDTSGATVLHAASSGADRERQDAKGLGSDERGHTGVKYPDADMPEFSGTHSAEGYAGGPSDDGSGAAKTVAQSYSGASGDSFADGGAGVSGSDVQTSQITSSVKTQSSGFTADSSSSGGDGGSSGGPATGTGAVPVGASGDIDSADTAPTYAATVAGTLRSEGELQPKGDDLSEGGIPETKTFTGNVGGDKDPGRLAEQKFEQINASVAGAGVTDTSSAGAEGNPYDALESSERA